MRLDGGAIPRTGPRRHLEGPPDAKVSGVLAPTAETVKVDGGYRVTGRWYYNSGSWHADWAGLGIPITDDTGQPVDQGMALIPRTDMDIEETWFVAGMKSSGSNCLIAQDVFVPAHRVVSIPPPSADTTPPSTLTKSSIGRRCHRC